MPRPCGQREFLPRSSRKAEKSSLAEAQREGVRGKLCYKMRLRDGGSQIVYVGPTEI